MHAALRRGRCFDVFFVGMQRDSARVADGRWTGLRVSVGAWSARVKESACILYRRPCEMVNWS
jgi:hypothetical protein